MFDIYKKQVNLKSIKKEKVLIQICCAPDLIVPLLELKKHFKLYLYWYNPNIQPYSEYKKRYNEYIKLLNLEKWDYEILDENGNILKKEMENNKIYNKYDEREFYDKLFEHRNIVDIKNNNYKDVMKDFSKMEEKNSKRCDICYYFRLLEPAQIAKKLWINYFTTTLLISPKKSVEKLDKYWKIITNIIWINYLSFDFRKNEWFKKAAEYTKEHKIWRQNYCGCLWAKKK